MQGSVPGVMWRLRDDKKIYEVSFQVHVTNDTDKDVTLPTEVKGHIEIDGIALPAGLTINEYGQEDLVLNPGESSYFQCVQDISGAKDLLKRVREHEGKTLPAVFKGLPFEVAPSQSYEVVIVPAATP